MRQRNFQTKLSCIAPFVFFPFIIITTKKKRVIYLFLLFITISLSSCFLNFYKTNTKPSIDTASVSKLISEKKYFIIHFSNSINGLKNVYVSNDSLYGKIVPLTLQQVNYARPDSNSNKNQVRGKDKESTLIQVHLYTDAALNINDSVFGAKVTSFNRADVYEFNQRATTTNHIISVSLIVLTVAGLIAIAANTPLDLGYNNYNCPQLYMDDNGISNFTSGLYCGAVYSTLERTDYLPLKNMSFNAKDISFKIANAKNEEQFINKVELMQVTHSKGVNVLTDRHGDIFTYKKTVAPLSAYANGKNNIKEALKQTDGQYYSFDNDANKNSLSDIRLIFEKPKNADEAKLIIHARNSYWSGIVHKEFTNSFGDDLEKWQTGYELPLMVYVKTNNGWKFVDYYQLIGNTASRDMVMQIDTKNIPGDKLELKLETAYRFWDLDFAGIDYGSEEKFTTTVLQPAMIIKSDTTDESAALQNSDEQYAHLQNDEFISFRYSVPQTACNTEASYFLVSSGYYHDLENITGKADSNKLSEFKKQGAIDKFSRKKYKEVQEVAAIMSNPNKN